MATENISIKAVNRSDITGSATRKLRKEGFVPCVIYGKQGTLNAAIPVKSFPATHTSSSVVELDIEGAKRTVLMREVQMDTMTTLPIHADFQEVTANETVLAMVPLSFTGLTKEQEKEASFKISVRAVQVKSVVSKLPKTLNVDVGTMKAGEAIHTGNIALPEGVALRSKKNLALASLMRM